MSDTIIRLENLARLVGGRIEIDGQAEYVTSKYLTYGVEHAGEAVINPGNLMERKKHN